MQANLFTTLALLLLVLAVHISVVEAFVPRHVSFNTNAITATKPSSSPSRLQQAAGPGGPGPTLDDRTRERLDQLVKNNKVLLFMKGNKIFPQWCSRLHPFSSCPPTVHPSHSLHPSLSTLPPPCSGFSNTACRILDALNTPYETVNVLEDEAIRSGVKVYSSWPTIPQLYVPPSLNVWGFLCML